jgi:3-oxoacyl-(acyl-carrier-protein) synthase
MVLSADQVLVTVGTGASLSAVGSTETHRALAENREDALGFAAFDAGLVNISGTAASPVFMDLAGAPLSIQDIRARFGEKLTAGMGIRALPRDHVAAHVLADIAALLPHDLEDAGLRRQAGITFDEIRHSPFKDMFGLFSDDPRLGPSLQSQLFIFAGLSALAALPRPLSELLPLPHRFRIAAACAFPGLEALDSLMLGMQPKLERVPDKANDKLAYRLATSLATHGPALVNALLSPGYNLSKVMRDPSLLSGLRREGDDFARVPQAPLVSMGACASALISLCDVATGMVLRYPGHVPPELVMLVAADASLRRDARVLEGFGIGALMSQQKLEALNQERSPEARRRISDSLSPFDMDAQGTVVGHGGSAMLITTLAFAVKNKLDVTSILAGWGQSGETGGKGHFAGVGFGGENAIIHALRMAHEAHGFGAGDFGHLVAHATGTRTNSRTDLATARAGVSAAAAQQGFTGALPRMTVSAPKALGDGHTMGETGLKALCEAVRYVLGERTMGIPTLRNADPELGDLPEHFVLSREPVSGNLDGGALVATQGFGGFDGAVAVRSATKEALGRYAFDAGCSATRHDLDAFLEAWPGLRSQRQEQEALARRLRGGPLAMAARHRWPGARD